MSINLNLVPADSHITIKALFSGFPSTGQEGTAGVTDLVPGSPSNRTTFQGTITIDVDDVLAPSTIQILSSVADADVSGVWLPQVRPYQDLDGDSVPGELGLPAEGGDSEVATNTNLSPAANADWGLKVRHPAFGVDVAYGAYRDISYDITSGVEPVTLGQFSSLSQHFEPGGFWDYWVAPSAGGIRGRTTANTGDPNFYGNTAPASQYTAIPLGGGMAQVALLIPILVDDMGDTLRSTYSGQFLATAIVLPGDFNNDGYVDAADYVAWRKTDGTPAGFNTWRANFGQSSGGGSVAGASATVPEPTTFVMLVLAAVGIRLWDRHIYERVPSTQ